jgi:DNA-binding response OmpR family regulator
MDIVIIEDDENLASSLKRGLIEQGFEVAHAASIAAARSLCQNHQPKLVILDLGLPDGDGLDLLAQCHQVHPETPVIITTARSELADRILGLDSGANDYLVKPYAFGELLARIHVQLRRGPTGAALHIADLALDTRHRTARRAGELIDLTPREFDLLRYLMEHRGQTVSRDMLARDVWKIRSRFTSMDNVIDVHISRLREKIDRGRPVRLLHTVRGVGFVLEESS